MKLIDICRAMLNSAAYMDHCIQTLLSAGEEAEIILVDDGSTDDTPAIADRYAQEYPDIVQVIHQPNGGHGEGVMRASATPPACTIKWWIRMIGWTRILWPGFSGPAAPVPG